MKKLIFFLAIVLMCLGVTAQKSQVNVDERTELLGVVFCLAEAEEYQPMDNGIKQYDNDIETYFSAFNEHPVVNYARTIREEYGIGYDAVMSFAVNLQIKNNKIEFIKDISDISIEKRWKGYSKTKFLNLLNNFYVHTKFNSFFNSHQSLYDKVVESFSHLLDGIDFSWFNSFFGKVQQNQFHLIISLTNGYQNYNANVKLNNGFEESYAVMGFWNTFDNNGLPIYPKEMEQFVIHEYTHAFTNPLINDSFEGTLEQIEKFYTLVETYMVRQAYGSPLTMMYESMVRACVIQYYVTKGINTKQMENQEKNKGFLFTSLLVNELAKYEKEREI